MIFPIPAAGVCADEGEHGCPDKGEAREGGEKHAVVDRSKRCSKELGVAVSTMQ